MDNVTTERLQFTGQKGQKLDGRLEKPISGQIRAVALFAHCFTCTKSSLAAKRITARLAAQGYAVLRFDFTGLGGSEGEFANSGFKANVEDLVAAADYLKTTLMPPALLIGHSLGGAAVIAAAEHLADVKAVITIGAPFQVDHILHQFGDDLERIKASDATEVTIGGRPFKVGHEFIAQTQGQPQAERLKNLNKALLVMHAPGDQIVGIDNASQIFVAAKHPKSFVSLNEADHLLTKEGAANYAADVIATWSKAYVTPVVQADAHLAAGVVSVETTGGKFTQNISTASHHFLADEPASFGGRDLGPTPYDLVLAGLGACTSMTIKMYADRKKIPLDSVRVELEHGREHATDCEEEGRADCQIDVIDRTIELRGQLSEDDQKKLMEIADKCPVHRTLENQISVRTAVVE
jgi:putative redox protein